ncbi:MAG: Holliday junction branch migration protein RuvA [Candidatus Shapirobacteria bacterium]|jgi:Holliday junction DNA helicase RuvA
MISSLKGKISRIGNNFVEIEVHDVGYLVWCGQNFLKRRNVDEELKIYTYQSVSETDISLFGFETIDDVNLFKMLISVSGIGPKTAAQIMSSAAEASEGRGSESIIKAIGEADVKFFEKVKGIGKKGAQRIIVDLKSKVGGLGELDLAADAKAMAAEDDDLSLSLKQLGFDRKEIEKVVAKLPDELETIEEKLEWCLNKI